MSVENVPNFALGAMFNVLFLAFLVQVPGMEEFLTMSDTPIYTPTVDRSNNLTTEDMAHMHREYMFTLRGSFLFTFQLLT